MLEDANHGAISLTIETDEPRNTIETAVARIWARLLGVERVGIHENFLLLGGESLLATQIAAHVRDELYVDISIRSILVGTVAEVAAEVSEKLAESPV